MRPVCPRRIWPGGSLPRHHSGRGSHRSGSCGQRLDGGPAAVRAGGDGTRDPDHYGHGRSHLRSGAGRLLSPGASVDRGPGRCPPPRDLPGHAQREGGGYRGEAGHDGSAPYAAPHGERHHRADGDDAGRAGGGRALRLAGAPRALRHRAQLRHGPRVHDRSPPLAERDRDLPRHRVSERGAPRRPRALRGDAAEPRPQDAPLRGGRLGQRHRRLLRDDAGPHRGARPHRPGPAPSRAAAVSGIEALYPTDDNRPVLVGERTNVIGSRRFKDLIVEEKFEEGAEIGRAQVKGGAQVLDACLANPDRDERTDMDRFMAQVTRKVKVPLMIDSTDAVVIESALRACQGKAVVNSINLEDGEERFEKVVPLLKRYGGAVIVGCIDEDKQQGMAVTRARKLAIAERSYALLTEKYGLPARDLIFDALVFPVGTGDANYIGSAVETIEGIRAIKARFPECKTVLGISNVSFGLPPAGREVLNAVFLYQCTKAGLDYAIVNSEKLERYASIPEEERRLAEDLIYWRGDDPVAAFAAHFRGRKKEAKSGVALPLDERLARCIVEGSKDGLIEDLDLKLREAAPLAIINGPLMKGMEEVGRLFNDNQLIVAEVLQSAEAMKAAVGHLETFMEKDESDTRATLILATVKGDVHDIGKNLVEIVLKNNGYRIINLGIKVPPEDLIAAYHQHKPDAFGLSGLLVKSAQQMVTTAEDLRAAGIDIPLFVGGAALTRKFTATRISVEYGGPTIYAKDAMDGLDLANRLFGATTREAMLERLRVEQEGLRAGAGAAEVAAPGPAVSEGVRSAVSRTVPIPRPPDLDPHVLRRVPLARIHPYLNLQMLLGKHLGLKGSVPRLLAEGDPKTLEILAVVEDLEREATQRGWLEANGVYRFFEARSAGEDLIVLADGKEAARFRFPRQRDGERLCLSDYVRDLASGEPDYVAMFAVTCGAGVRELAERWKEAGQYLRSHAIQALAIELAEALAEMLHARLRTQWGFPDSPDLAMDDRLKARYRGLRVSFGYPACPNLADQRILFDLLQPEQIGIGLTEGFMMDPEASVSALVFHHPEAKYFKAG